MTQRSLAVALAIATGLGSTWIAAAGRDLPLVVQSTPGAGVWLTQSPQPHGTELVSALLRSDINVFVDLGTTRDTSVVDLCLDLSDPADDADVIPAPVCTDMHFNTSGAEDMRAMTSGQVHHKRLQIAWLDSDGTTYRLRFGTDAGTDLLLVECLATSGSRCRAWSVCPDGQAIGRLESKGSSKQSPWLPIGNYRVPFTWSVEIQQ